MISAFNTIIKWKKDLWTLVVEYTEAQKQQGENSIQSDFEEQVSEMRNYYLKEVSFFKRKSFK